MNLPNKLTVGRFVLTGIFLIVFFARSRFADSISLVATIRAGLKHTGWPVRGPDPAPGSILPGKRIVAFYGNPLSKKMGILGEIPYDQMLAKLDTVVGWWKQADPSTPVMPALHLNVSVAQGDPGRELFLLLDGILSVSVDDRKLAEVGPGAILGERALLEGGTRTASLRAITDCTVAVAAEGQLDRDALARVAAHHHREDRNTPS